jgi:hypothetical protein
MALRGTTASVKVHVEKNGSCSDQVVALILSMIAPAQAELKTQAFKEYGFSTTLPLTLTHQPTEAGKEQQQPN